MSDSLSELESRLRDALAAGVPLTVILGHVRAYAGAGGQQEGAARLLRALLADSADADQDVVMDVLDFVVGNCRVDRAIWPPEPPAH